MPTTLTTDTGGQKPDADILVRDDGCLGVIALNRPKARNALTVAMKAAVPPALERWARDAKIYAGAVTSNDPRAFSAGGDLRELLSIAETDLEAADKSLADEYRLNWQLLCFTKPTIAWIDGMVMGSGVGLSIYATHRVAGPNYRFAMPEAAIGFFPDVGATWFLSRLEGHVGTYLALTGRQIGRADALELGLISYCATPDAFAPVMAGLADADPIDPLLSTHAATSLDEERPELTPYRDVIADAFAGETVAEVIARLRSVPGAHAEWAQGTADAIAANAPSSCAIALRQMQLGRELDLSAALRLEYRLARRMLRHPDLHEGVRARLIDKDQAPVWQTEPFNEADLDALFDGATGEDASGGHELKLPPAPVVPKALASME